jgi:uncharacterized protein (TIGR03067 family)
VTTDLDKLQGTWRIVSLETDGERTEATVLNEARIEINGNRFTAIGTGAPYEGTIELRGRRGTSTSKAFDLLFTAGPPKGQRNPGIYELDGDRWTMCLATRGSVRPRTFATRPGTGLVLETFERDDSKRSSRESKQPSKRTVAESTTAAASLAVTAASGSATELEGEWQMVSGVFNGKPLDQSMVTWCKRVTRADITAVVAGPNLMLKARFTLDPSKRPAEIDYVNLEGASRGKSQAGIYEVDGPSLKVCMAAPGKRRPPAFESSAGDGRSLTTWRLEKR